MAAGNTITVIGNVTREPELRFTPSGQANVKFGLAVNRRWQEKSSGEWQEATSFFDVVPRTTLSSSRITRLPATCERLAECLRRTPRSRISCCGWMKVRPT